MVECTGTFRDPHAEPDAAWGALRGHLAAGARALVQSSPFKSRKKGVPLPDDRGLFMHGINDFEFERTKHKLVSAAARTTTALAHMMRPLLDRDLTRNMITAGMSTVHSATNSQPVLDAVPKAGATDLRKGRGALDAIMFTSTNAAAALEQVMPEIAAIGFMADSLRIPTQSVSLVILNVTFQSEALSDGTVSVERDVINTIYRDAAEGTTRGRLKFSEAQNVSTDMLGENAAVAIEGVETHTRTGFMNLNVPAKPGKDDEMGSYAYCLGELTVHVARHLQKGSRRLRRPTASGVDVAGQCEQPAQAVVHGRFGQRRVRASRQLLQAQVRVAQAQFGDRA